MLLSIQSAINLSSAIVLSSLKQNVSNIFLSFAPEDCFTIHYTSDGNAHFLDEIKYPEVAESVLKPVL